MPGPLTMPHSKQVKRSNEQKLHIKTWGCQMNEYDSSKMADLLDASNGYTLTEEPEEADVLLLNTCSIREKRRRRCFTSWDAGRSSRQTNPVW